MSNDLSWRPTVPLGHTKFSWGTRKPQPANHNSNSNSTDKPKSKPDTNAFLAASRSLGGEILPSAEKRNILITSALPYVNNVPHLGTLIGCVLSADVYARFCRLRGHNTVYICGTDEYGTATENKAIEEKTTPKAICDKYFTIHSRIYKYFDIDFDNFGRTTTNEQTEVTQEIFNDLDKNGYISESSVEQLYCDNCQKFLADRFVEGTCPECAYPDARGDQCDKCSKLINPIELKNPRCKTCSKEPKPRNSNHLFIDLNTLTTPLTQWLEISNKSPNWTSNASAITEEWIKKGLQPRCITRDLKWGTPVPKHKINYNDKVFYVWFDAPIGYISMTATYTSQWKKWWFAGQGFVNDQNKYVLNNNDNKQPNVELVQFMGKDNVPFHCVLFPSSLLGTKKNYTLLHRISTTEFLNYEGGKFSKSRSIGVFGDDVEQTGIPVEVWRYYLLVNRPENADTMFLWDDFASKNNNELLSNIGNLVQRTLSFIDSKYNGIIPKIDENRSSFSPQDKKFVEELESSVNEYIANLEIVNMREALKLVMSISSEANKFIQLNAPWNLIESDKAACDRVVSFGANFIATVALLAEPFMPSFSVKVYNQLQWSPSIAPLSGSKFEFKFFLSANHKIGSPTPIFRQIGESEVVQIRRRFAEKGTQVKIPLDLRVGKIVHVQDHPKLPTHVICKVQIGANNNNNNGNDNANDGFISVVPKLGKTAYADRNSLLNLYVAVMVNVSPSDVKKEKFNGYLLGGVKVPSITEIITLSNVSDDDLGKSILPENAEFDKTVEFFDTKDWKRYKFSINDQLQVTFDGLPFQYTNSKGQTFQVVAQTKQLVKGSEVALL